MKYYRKYLYMFLSLNFLQISCKKFVDIGAPVASLVQEKVFDNNDQAIAAVTGMYAYMANSNSYASGSNFSITCLSGTSSDELLGYTSNIIPFYENQISSDNGLIGQLYSGPYNNIYAANAILEGLSAPNGVTTPVKRQLEGEAYFVRAFAYFNLVNLFGQVPLQLTTDYRVTQVADRASINQVYEQIISDLKKAEILLLDTYPSTGRVRPNKSAAQSMLARVFLYLKDWENAEKYSSLVIAKTDIYNLVPFDNIFLGSSQEAIWQLFPSVNSTAQDGTLFIPVSSTTIPATVSLRNSFALSAFEVNDRRQVEWIRSITVGALTYYYPFKYKVRTATTATEYSTILRLAEQYLIRAEARINQEKIDVGIADLNIVRRRQLPNGTYANSIGPLSLLDKAGALLAVEQERKIELFSEWGHRWFDLKRTGRADQILGTIKLLWKPSSKLYPIPLNEVTRNTNIIQNEGY